MSGMFLAAAALKRLNLAHEITEVLEPDVFLPAPGQGALAIEGRDNEQAAALLSPLDHTETRARVTAERNLLATLEGGCQVPIGALATLQGDDLLLDGLIADVDGRRLIRSSVRGRRSEAASLGATLAERLLADGGAAILADLKQLGG